MQHERCTITQLENKGKNKYDFVLQNERKQIVGCGRRETDRVVRIQAESLKIHTSFPPVSFDQVQFIKLESYLCLHKMNTITFEFNLIYLTGFSGRAGRWSRGRSTSDVVHCGHIEFVFRVRTERAHHIEHCDDAADLTERLKGSNV